MQVSDVGQGMAPVYRRPVADLLLVAEGAKTPQITTVARNGMRSQSPLAAQMLDEAPYLRLYRCGWACHADRAGMDAGLQKAPQA